MARKDSVVLQFNPDSCATYIEGLKPWMVPCREQIELTLCAAVSVNYSYGIEAKTPVVLSRKTLGNRLGNIVFKTMLKDFGLAFENEKDFDYSQEESDQIRRVLKFYRMMLESLFTHKFGLPVGIVPKHSRISQPLLADEGMVFSNKDARVVNSVLWAMLGHSESSEFWQKKIKPEQVVKLVVRTLQS